MICSRCLHSDHHRSCGNEVVDLCKEATHFDNDKANDMTAALSDVRDVIKCMKDEVDRKNTTSITQEKKCKEDLDDLENKLKRNVEESIRGFSEEACKVNKENQDALSCISSVCDEKLLWIDDEERQIDDFVSNSLSGSLYLLGRNFDKRISEVKKQLKEAEFKHTFKHFCLKQNKVALKCLLEDLRDVCEVQDEVDGSDEGTTKSVESTRQETLMARKELIKALMQAKLDEAEAENTKQELCNELKQVKKDLDDSEKAKRGFEQELLKAKQSIENSEKAKERGLEQELLKANQGKETKQELYVEVEQVKQDLDNTEKNTDLKQAQELKEQGNKSFLAAKYNEAIAFYTQAIEVCPAENKDELSKFYANRAAAYEKLEIPQEVLENCTDAIKLNGKYTKALLRRAKAAEQLGDLQMSLEDVTTVCLLEEFKNQATVQMADKVLKALGKENAKEELKKKKKRMPSKHFLKSYFSSFTQDPVQQFEEPEEKVLNIPVDDESIEENAGQSGAGDNPAVNGLSTSAEKSVFSKALASLKAGDYEQIIPLCTEELRLTPHSPYQQLALLLRGTMFNLTAQTSEAIADFDKLLEVDNLDKKVKVNALIKRGGLYINQGRRTDGLDDFAQAIRIDSSNSDIYHHRGYQNIQIDRLEDAIRDFGNSISKNPDFPNSYIQKSYAEHRRAAAEKSTTKLEMAIKSFKQTLKMFPDNPDGHALYAYALCELGRFEDADNVLETAIKLEPDNANTLVQKALLKLHWKQTIDESVALIKQAIDLDYKCEYAYEMLGTIEVQRGDRVNAVKFFKKAIDLCCTELRMSHLFFLLHASKAQLKASEMLEIPLPKGFSPM
ncbi:mitochondrial import receptor subunit TOM70-like [Mya arenaria]|uniref:mitochondrial import receptor subunit TOM70-like n=1 Tax=Mya arenaria TaxID=6604 RepID=UPI0022E63322|nr:mitochondrial import receptor subunit TOM70-like [Mya arenaria]